jgi:hypothetical protein
MKTKKEKTESKATETIKSDVKRLSPLGKWYYDPNKKPWIKIIDMKAVLK